MKHAGAVVVATALLVTGCLQGFPTAHAPSYPGTDWSEWAGPWATMTGGCGQCQGTLAQEAEHEWMGLDHSGRVLRLSYAQGSEGLQIVDPAHESWRPAIEALLGMHLPHAGIPPAIRIFDVHARQMSAEDARQVDDVLQELRAGLRNSSYEQDGIDDAGAVRLQVDDVHGYKQAVGRPDQWDAVGAQMQLVEAWIVAQA